MRTRKYITKNFKGNITESIRNFVKKFPNEHVKQAKIVEEGLEIDTEMDESSDAWGDAGQAMGRLSNLWKQRDDLKSQLSIIQKKIDNLDTQIRALTRYID